MDRKSRRRRERMILAGANRPFELCGSAVVNIEAGAPDATAPATVLIEAYSGGLMNVDGIGQMVADVRGIEADGRVSAQLQPLTAGVLDVTVQGMQGLTPFTRLGNAPALGAALAALAAALLASRAGGRGQTR